MPCCSPGLLASPLQEPTSVVSRAVKTVWCVERLSRSKLQSIAQNGLMGKKMMSVPPMPIGDCIIFL